MNKSDNNKPPIIAEFGSVIGDHDGVQLIKTRVFILYLIA
jgi:hypothetical protein